MYFRVCIAIMQRMKLVAVADIIAESTNRNRRTVLVVTALDLELQAVLAHIDDVASVLGRDGGVYECGVFREGNQEWLVVTIETGAGNHSAQSAVTNAHIDFAPELQIFVGVAGSRKSDVPIGSVVAADHVYSPYGGKYDDKGLSARPREFAANSRLLNVARKVRRDKKWTTRIRDLADRKLPPLDNYPCGFPPLSTIAPAISTEAVSASKTSELEALIAQHYGDANIVEMEGFGALFAANQEGKPAIVIRGVSDMADKKEPETDKVRQPVAAAHAAAFGFELIASWTAFYPTAYPETAPISEPGAGDPAMPMHAKEATPAQKQGGARYVLNLDADAATVSAARIAEIELLLRELAAEPGITVEGTEEGSLRVIIRDPSAALERVGASRLREEIENRLSMHMFGLVPEHSIDELADVAAEMRAASHDLLSWPDTLASGEQLERAELAQLLAIPDDRLNSVTTLIGDPGSGKSALLAMLGKRLIELGHPVLAIKADLLDTAITNEADLRERLGLSDRPSTLLTRMAALRPTFLLIDQLDALAGYLDLRTGRLSTLLNLVRRLGRTDNIHIVLSARKFEYEHDVRLRAIAADSLQLELPAWSQVLLLLESKGIAAAGWPADAQEVLRSPQALATYLQLEESVRSETLASYQAMLDRLWEERVLSGPGGPARSKFAAELADLMAEQESLWLPRALFDDAKSEVDGLIASGVLAANAAGSSIGFAHQTVFDFALARAFAKERGRLTSFVLERQASIFLRPKVWAALTYLRGADPVGYEGEITQLCATEGLRRHLRLLLIEFLGQQRAPTDKEEALLCDAFSRPEERALAFRAIIGSPGWFDRLDRTLIAQAMDEQGPARDWVVNVLSTAIEFAAPQVEELLEQHWLPSAEDDFRIWSVLQRAPRWSDRMLVIGQTILGRSQVAPIYIDHLVGEIGIEQPGVALALVRAALDRRLALARAKAAERQDAKATEEDETQVAIWRARNEPGSAIKTLLETSNEWDMLASLAAQSPALMLNTLWPWFVAALEAVLEFGLELRDRPIYPLQFVADNRFEDEHSLGLPEPSLPAALRVAIERLAVDRPGDLRKWMKSALSAEFHPAHRLIAHAMASNPEEFASEALDYLLEDPRRLQLGNLEGFTSTTTRLIAAAAPHWSPEQIARFEQHIWDYKPAIPDDLSTPEGRRTWHNITRRLRLNLLRAVPRKSTTRETSNRLRTEERAIGRDRMGVEFSGVFSPASPMSADEMARARNEDILTAFQRLPDATHWDHPSDFRKGGNVQLSREFGNFAKADPARAITLIEKFEPAFGERAAGYAISEMGERVDAFALQALIVSLAGRGFGGEEFRGSIASALEVLINRKVPLTDEIIALLRTWLFEDKAADEADGDVEHNTDAETLEDDPNARSLLWGYGGMSVLPGGAYPLLHALMRHFLVVQDKEALAELLQQCLPKNLELTVWQHLLPTLRFLRPPEGGDATSAIDVIGGIVARYPTLRGSKDLAFLLGHVHWWAPEFVEQELTHWRSLTGRTVQQGYGELVALLAFLHGDREWPRGELATIEQGGGSHARAGAALTVVNLWGEPAQRDRATAFLVRLTPSASEAEWGAIFDLFRINDDLLPDENTGVLLEAIADHIADAPTVSATFIVDRLQALLPHEATLVARLAIGLVEKWRNELGDIRTGPAAHASDLVNLAVTLHRLGPATREEGTHLFELLIEVDAYEARSTLDEIDSRFRPFRSIRRPRLRRREKVGKRRRRVT